MGVLDSDLITRLVKATNDKEPEKNEGVLYGTVVDDGIRKYVKLDGSEESTPISTTTDISANDRVIVQLKNHTATVTGNVSDPAVGIKRANGLESKIEQTAEQITLEVSNEITRMESKITQTASEIRSEVSNEVSGLNSTITQTASDLRSEFTDKTSGFESKITQNANSITTIVKNQDEFSEFKQTVEGFSFMGNGGTVKISGGDINLTGSIKFSDLDSSAQNTINNASTNASNAVTTANTAKTTANEAKSLVNSVSSTANDAWFKADSAEEIAAEAKSIANNMSLPSYLQRTYIDSTTIMSPSIIGGQFYAVDEDSYMEINANGLAVYVSDLTYPKFEIQNYDSFVNFMLGSGNTGGDNKGRFMIQKDTTGTSLLYITPSGEYCGFRFNSDATIDTYGTLNS